MRIFLKTLAGVAVSVPAMAECQFNIDPAQLPAEAANIRVLGCASSFNGIPLGCFQAVVSSGGDPFLISAVFPQDCCWGNFMWTSITLTFECDGQDHESILEFAPYSFYCLDWWPYPVPTLTFPGIDPETACDPQETSGAFDRPPDFQLDAAFPNPFNPATTIRITMPETRMARLTVHDCRGSRVAVLHDGLLAAGAHELAFDGSNLPSGIYLYTLEAEGQKATGKMLLVK